MTTRMAYVIMLLATVVSACSSTANVGLMTHGAASPGDLLAEARPYEEVGPVEGQACRYFFAAVIPWGDSTPTAAMNKALAGTDGDAIINASITTSLYGFVPIYNVFAFTCTTVKGTAVKFTG